MRVIIQGSGPTVGMEYTDALGIYDSFKDAEEDALSYAADHVSAYGYDWNPDGEDDYETTCTELNYSLEEYDPAKHDDERSGGGSFEEDFERMENG